MTSQHEWENLVDQIADASTQAREILADVRSELKEARRVIRELKKERDEGVKKAVDEAIEEAVKKGLEEYQGTVKKAMHDAVDHIQAEFEKLFNTYMTGRGRGGSPDEDLRTILRKPKRSNS